MNINSVVPSFIPITFPELSIDATTGFELDQIPPDAGKTEEVPPIQIWLEPKNEAFIVATTSRGCVVEEHPFRSVNVNETLPVS